MKPEQASRRLHSMLRAVARMQEFNISDAHIDTQGSNYDDLFPLVIGTLGDEAARFSNADNVFSAGVMRLLPEDFPGLHFAATFFNAYLNAQQNTKLNKELLVLGAATYYLADFAGSASVLAKEVYQNNRDGDDLMLLLEWLLNNDWKEYPSFRQSWYSEILNSIAMAFAFYFYNGTLKQNLIDSCHALKKLVYDKGTPRELLFSDVICAVVSKRLRNSSRQALPAYSDLLQEQWQEVFNKPNFMKELWPSQHLLGEHGILRGISAIVQMPTSAGKTRAIELVIRSAFFANRANLAVVVAPFRALCNEITNSLLSAFYTEDITINELSDALQADYSEIFSSLLNFDIAQFKKKQIVIITPEKLLYVLRHSPKLVDAVGLVIYDEGHQFDSGMRGITYELLLTSIKHLLPSQAQTLLISAVIQNAEAVGGWLIGEHAEIVRGESLSTTERSVAFASWTYPLGQLQFIEPENPDAFDYFVPRIIEQQMLNKKNNREKERYFPEKNDPKSVALYLGLKVVSKGSVAIFCGKKATVSTMTEYLIDLCVRGLTLIPPSIFSDNGELSNLIALYTRHFGSDAVATKCATLGIFSHHGNTPHGIRLAVEHAMKEGLIKFVLCTSTLAQGVNLPVRYLIISGTRQSREQIKARDFHNLLGRVGRAGMYIEGSVLFSDTSIFDKRYMYQEKWRWEAAINLLNPVNKEVLGSSLLSILKPFHSENKKTNLESDIVEILIYSMKNILEVKKLLSSTAQAHADKKFTEKSLYEQLQEKLWLLEALQSYLMSHRGNESVENFYIETERLAKETLAYHLADNAQKEILIHLFLNVARYIEEIEPNPTIQAIYGRTLLGVISASQVRNWVIQKQDFLNAATNTDELLELIWPLLVEQLNDNLFDLYFPEQAIIKLVNGWVSGSSFNEIFDTWKTDGGAKKYGRGKRKLKLDDIVDLCENIFGYRSTLVVAAIVEFVETLQIEHKNDVILMLGFLQKRLKYGVADMASVSLFEMGFADRMIATEMGSFIDQNDKRPLKDVLKNEQIALLVKQYPGYYMGVYHRLTKN